MIAAGGQAVVSALAADWPVYLGLCVCLGLSVGLNRFLSQCSQAWEARLKGHKVRIGSLEAESEAQRAEQRELHALHQTFKRREDDIKKGNTGTVLNSEMGPDSPAPPNHPLSLRLLRPATVTLNFHVEWHFTGVGIQDLQVYRVELCDKSDPDQCHPLATISPSGLMQPMKAFKAIEAVVNPRTEFEARLVRKAQSWKGKTVKERSTNSVFIQGSVAQLSAEELRQEEERRHSEEPQPPPREGSGREVPEGTFSLWCESAKMQAEVVGEGRMREEGMGPCSLHLLDPRFQTLEKVPLKGERPAEGRGGPPEGMVGFSGQFPTVPLEVRGWGEKHAMVAVFRNNELLQQGPLRLQLSVRNHDEL